MSALPHEAVWIAKVLPPVALRETLALRVTYKTEMHSHGYKDCTQVNMYLVAPAVPKVRARSTRWRIGALKFAYGTARVEIEPHVLRYLDVIAIRFGVTIKEVHWWGERGQRKGDYELD